MGRINEELEPSKPNQVFEVEYAVACEYHGHAIILLAELRSKIEELETSRHPTVPAGGTTASSPADPVYRISGSRLPKLNISTFRGDTTHRRTSWEQFEGTMHSI